MLRIALPKGSLEEQTSRLFAEADLAIERRSRTYACRVDDPRIDEVRFLRPQEIPVFVGEGYFDVGISGYDCIVESGADVEIIAELPYSRATTRPVKMVIAVPEDSPVMRPEDIDHGARVTTEFPNIARRFFEELSIPVEVFYSYGATEAKVPDIMDVVVDLTETGETLRRNNLKVIGTIMESTTKLFVNRDSWADPERHQAIEEVKTLLIGVIDARGRVLLSMNVPADRLDEVVESLPAMKRPTVSKLYNSEYYEVITVAEKRTVNLLIPELKRHGAEDILEIPISKIVR